MLSLPGGKEVRISCVDVVSYYKVRLGFTAPPGVSILRSELIGGDPSRPRDPQRN